MVFQPAFPDVLQRFEFIRPVLILRVLEPFQLPILGVLQLRRELQQAWRVLRDTGHPAAAAAGKLLRPQQPDDPVLLQHVQQPSPALVLRPASDLQGAITEQQTIALPVLLFGSGLQGLEALLALVEEWGRLGFYNGGGRFVLEQVAVVDACGTLRPYWSAGTPRPEELPEITDAAWWLEQQPWIGGDVCLEISTPMRLLRRGRPLFKASSGDFLPYLLRRVQTMLAIHAGVDLSDEISLLRERCGQVAASSGLLRWQDWRTLNRPAAVQPVGGLLGRLNLPTKEFPDLLWVLHLGRLLNVGKGAAYGAGQYRLHDSVERGPATR